MRLVFVVCLVVLALAEEEKKKGKDDAKDRGPLAIKWSKEDAEICPKSEFRQDTSGCKIVKEDGVLNIPSVDDCIEWAKQGPDDSFDYENYCELIRFPCQQLLSKRKEKAVKGFEITQCALTSIVLKEYNKDITDGRFTPSSGTKPAEKPEKPEKTEKEA